MSEIKRTRLTWASETPADPPPSLGTVGRFLLILRGLLTQYDMQWNKQNIYAIGHYMKALGQVRDDVAGLEEKDDPAALKKLRASVNKRFIPDFSPIKRWNKALDAFLATGTPPKYQAVKMRYAASPTGLYGHTRATQRDCEAAGRKLAKVALRIARSAFEKDGEVVPFLQAHAKREGSRSAKVLLAAMREIGPKVASTMRGGIPKEAGSPTHGLYGYKSRTADLGLDSCKSLRASAGHIASDLHRRRGDMHEKITGFFKEHSKQGRCLYSGMLLSCYPDATMKIASDRAAGGGAGVEAILSGASRKWRIPERVWINDASATLDPTGSVSGSIPVENVGLGSYQDFAFVKRVGQLDAVELNPSEWRAFKARAVGFAEENGFSSDQVVFKVEINSLQDEMLSRGFIRGKAPSDFDVEGVALVSAEWGDLSGLDEEIGFTGNLRTTPDFRAAWEALDDPDLSEDDPKRFASKNAAAGEWIEWEP